MAIVLGTGFVLSEVDEIPGTPWIGWHNVVSDSPQNITTTTNVADSVNLTNPSTNLKWAGTTATEQYITTTTDPVTTGEGDVDYLGVARHNFGTAGIAVSVEALTTNPATDTQTRLLLHFDDAGLSPDVFIDSSPGAHVFTNNGNTFHDTSTKQFGIASGFFDGTNDWISTPDHADFTLGANDFTIEFRFNCTAPASGGGNVNVTGQYTGVATASAWYIYRTSLNTFNFGYAVGAVFSEIGISLLQFTSALNTGWHHMAIVRSGTTITPYLDGVAGTSATGVGTINDSATSLQIGTMASGSTSWKGWIDEFRLSVGVARYTAAFTPPTIAFPWAELTSPTVPADDSPLMFRFDPASYYQVRLRMQAGSEPPEAAVVYIGELLVCERSIDVNVEHVPVTYGRRTHVVNGMSQSGEFLGRIVIGEHRATKAEFKWFQDTWWRTNFDPFLEAAQSIPFFWAWSPEEYPAECGYVWLTNDAEASVDTVTRRVHTELVMEGVA